MPLSPFRFPPTNAFKIRLNLLRLSLPTKSTTNFCFVLSCIDLDGKPAGEIAWVNQPAITSWPTTLIIDCMESLIGSNMKLGMFPAPALIMACNNTGPFALSNTPHVVKTSMKPNTARPHSLFCIVNPAVVNSTIGPFCHRVVNNPVMWRHVSRSSMNNAVTKSGWAFMDPQEYKNFNDDSMDDVMIATNCCWKCSLSAADTVDGLGEEGEEGEDAPGKREEAVWTI